MKNLFILIEKGHMWEEIKKKKKGERISNEMNNSKFLQVKSQQCFPKMAFSFIGFFPLEAKGKKLGGKLTQSLDKNLRENWDGCKAQQLAAETADFLSQ